MSATETSIPIEPMDPAFQSMLDEILAIPLPTGDDRRDTMRAAQNLYTKRSNAVAALKALADDDAVNAEVMIAKLSTLADAAHSQLKTAQKHFIDFALIPLSAKAAPNSPYPILYAYKRCIAGGSAADAMYHAKIEMDWCASPLYRDRINPNTVATINGAYRGAEATVETVYDLSTSYLLTLYTWMTEQAAKKGAASLAKKAKADRQRELKATNRERSKAGLPALPDPDTRKGLAEIKDLARAVKHAATYTQRDSYYTQDYTAEQFAEADAKHAAELEKFNLAVYGIHPAPEGARTPHQWCCL